MLSNVASIRTRRESNELDISFVSIHLFMRIKNLCAQLSMINFLSDKEKCALTTMETLLPNEFHHRKSHVTALWDEITWLAADWSHSQYLYVVLVIHLLILHNCVPKQIKSLLLSHHHSTSALVSEILTSVLQTVQKNKTTIYIWTVHIYRLYRRQCAKYTYIYSVHTVYYKDILRYQYTLYTVFTRLHYVHIYA